MNTTEPFKPIKTLGVCAPSARFDIQTFNCGVKAIEKSGFKVHVPEGIFHQKRYLAGEDLHRASIIHELFANPEIDGIICARGGFGALRLLDHLDWELIKKNPKPFIGFSDATAILVSLLDKSEIPVIHGPTVVSMATADQQTIDFFVQVLTTSHPPLEMRCEQVINHGKGMGLLKGGNISTLSHLTGTRFAPDFNQAVIFLEEINEPAYKIDRMLSQMKMAGRFNAVSGVVTGSFHGCANSNYIDEILAETFDDGSVPILTGLCCGHGPVNLSLPMGKMVSVDSRTLTLRWIGKI